MIASHDSIRYLRDGFSRLFDLRVQSPQSSTVASHLRELLPYYKTAFRFPKESLFNREVDTRINLLAKCLATLPPQHQLTPTLFNGLLNALRLSGLYPNQDEKNEHFFTRLEGYFQEEVHPAAIEIARSSTPSQGNVFKSDRQSLVSLATYESGGVQHPVTFKKYYCFEPSPRKAITIQEIHNREAFLSDLCYQTNELLARSAMMIWGWGIDGNNPYTISDYAHGNSLYDWISKRTTPHDVDPKELETMLKGVVGAVADWHDLGIVHRDVKPSNFVILRGRMPHHAEIRGIDFGLARSVAELRQLPPGFEHQRGTLVYMAPELRIQKAALGGPPADVYATGVVLYMSYTGDRDPARLRDLAEILDREPLSEIPRGARAVIRTAVAPDPNMRFDDGAALQRAFLGAI